MRLTRVAEIRVSHAGSEGHGLWLSDQILGAYGDALCGADNARPWLEDWSLALGSVELIRVPL